MLYVDAFNPKGEVADWDPATIADPRVSAAFAGLDRVEFLSQSYLSTAGADYVARIGSKGQQFSIKPSVGAGMLVDLSIEPESRVLEVGTGTGFLTVPEARLGGYVIGTEIDDDLIDLATSNLDRYGVDNATVVKPESGVLGLPSEGPFDRIVVCGWIGEEQRDELLAQLDPVSGVMVAPITTRPDGNKPIQWAAITKISQLDGITIQEVADTLQFTPIQ